MKASRKPNGQTSSAPQQWWKYLDRNSCLAPSESLCDMCSTRWAATGCTGPHLHTWWCWSCSRMTCDLWWEMRSAPTTPQLPSHSPSAPPATHAPWEQDFSSEPSPQSSKKLQRRLALMHFLFSHRNSFLSWLQLLGLAVGDSVGARAAAVTLCGPGHPAPRVRRGESGRGRVPGY